MVPAMPIGFGFQQYRSFTQAASVHGFTHLFIHRQHIIAVHLMSLHAIALASLIQIRHPAHFFDRAGYCILIIFQHEDYG